MSIEPEAEIEETGQPLWVQKFILWASMQKSCPASRGPNGIYCMWEGRNCGYNNCPRRIFEEVMVDPDSIPQPKPKPKVKAQLQTLENQNKEQRKKIDDLTKRLEKLEKAKI